MNIIAVNGGWAIRWEEGRHICFQGWDGYIARSAENVTPFPSKDDAAYAAELAQ